MTGDGHELWAAVLTPPGMGAMAVIRLSGYDAPDVLRRCFAPKHAAAIDNLQPDRLAYGRIFDGEETVDDGIVSLRPHDRMGYIAELTVHGGVRVVERVLLLLQRLGARIERDADLAIARSDMTPIDADVLHALTRAKTKRAVRFLARQRDALPSELRSIVETCERDEDRGRDLLVALLNRSRGARLLVEGGTLAVLGPVNAGKSTLLNRLFAPSRSLVSDEPGTTLDWVGVETAIDGIPIEAIDTAGMRPGADAIEREAANRGLQLARDADVQLIVMDGSDAFPSLFLDQYRTTIDPSRAVAVLNKSDLPHAWPATRLAPFRVATARTSGLFGEGLVALTELILTILGVEPGHDPSPALFTRGKVEWLGRLLLDKPASRLAESVRTEFPGVFHAPDRPQ